MLGHESRRPFEHRAVQNRDGIGLAQLTQPRKQFEARPQSIFLRHGPEGHQVFEGTVLSLRQRGFSSSSASSKPAQQ